MADETWIDGLDDLDLLVAQCPTAPGGMVIFAFQVDFYRRRNHTFRRITAAERAKYEEQISDFAAGVRRDSKRYALT